MSSVPMPRDLSEEAVAEWRNAVLREAAKSLPLGAHSGIGVSFQALRAYDRAVRSLVEQKVREAAGLACRSPYSNTRSIVDYVVSRVMGDHPAGGHDEGRQAREEAPRG